LLVLLPNTDPAGAERVIEKVYDRLERRLGETEAFVTGRLSLSVGVAAAAHPAPFQELLEVALSELRPVSGSLERACAQQPVEATVRKPRAVIAEDDPITASIIRHRLERLGCEVIHVTDGDALLKIAPEVDPALLLVDVKMPYVDGFEALRRLRSVRSLRQVPVIMVTSMGNEEDIAHGFELGADDYLVKPFSPIELQARVQRLLRQVT
jgi:PleD family two-component response regulator